jgi:hypothetical protein
MSHEDNPDPEGSATDGEQTMWCGDNRGWMQLVDYWNMTERLEEVRIELGHDSVENTLDIFLGYYEMEGSQFRSWLDEQSEHRSDRCTKCKKIFDKSNLLEICSECQDDIHKSDSG